MMSVRAGIFMCAFSAVIWGCAANSTQKPSRFDFEYFENMKVGRKFAMQQYLNNIQPGMPKVESEAVNAALARAANEYLNNKFPAGSLAMAAVREVTDAGAKCGFNHGTVRFNMPSGDFYLCRYQRPGHGFMFFVSEIEWTVSIFTDPDAKFVKAIWVGRGATGP